MSDSCLCKYLEGLAKSTQVSRIGILRSFFDFAGCEPSEAIEFQRVKPVSYRFVDLIYDWIENRDLRVSSKKTHASCIRGFFLANRAPLPREKHKFRSDKTPVTGELTLDEFRKIVINSNLTYRAAFLVMFQSGSGVGELRHINENLAGHVWDEVKRDKRIIRLNMPGRKANRNEKPYYTYIGGDTIDALKNLFRSRGWKPDGVLFRTERGDPVSSQSLQSYFRRHTMKLGFINPKTPKCVECGGETIKIRRQKRINADRKSDLTYYVCLGCGLDRLANEYNVNQAEYTSIRYRMRTHEIRDLFRTEWHRGQTFFGVDPDVGEFMMGHTIDELAYDKIMRDKSYTLDQYRKAMPMLNVLSEDPRKIERSEVQDQLEASKAEVDALSRQLAEMRKDSEAFKDIVEVLRDPENMRRFKGFFKQKH